MMRLNLLIGLLAFAPVGVYLVSILKTRLRPTDSEQFFLARGQLSPFQFANSAVGNGFQIASVSAFLAWGFLFGPGAFVNPVFWGLGILLFSSVLIRLIPFLRENQTLHGFLGSRYRSRTVAVLASSMTLVGFLGAYVAELAWGAVALSLVSDSEYFIASVVTTLGIFMAIYIHRAGQVSALRADQFQLLFSYLGFLTIGVAILTLLIRGNEEGRAIGLLLNAAMSLLLFVMLMIIVRQLLNERSDKSFAPTSKAFRFSDVIVKPSLLIIIGFSLIICIVNTMQALPALSLVPGALGSLWKSSLRQSGLDLLSLALLPLFWQFIDVSLWQRLSSVHIEHGADAPNTVRPVRAGLLRFAFESPTSWLFAVILGIALRFASIGIDENNAYNAISVIPNALASGLTPFGVGLGSLFAAIFAAGIVATMLSTADALLMGSILVFAYDIEPSIRQRPKGNPPSVVSTGQWATAAFVSVALILIWLQTIAGLTILPILLGAYAAQLSLAPSVMGTLLLGNRTPSAFWAILSILLGFVTSAWTAFHGLSNPTWQLYPPLVALGVSFGIYTIGFGVTKMK